MKTRVLLAVVVVCSAFGSVLMSYGMRHVGDISRLPPPQLLEAAIGALFTPWVAAGVLLEICYFLGYTTALSRADLTYVLPTTAVGYILVAALSRVFLHEEVHASRWAGTALIAFGFILVARTEVRTTPIPPASLPHRAQSGRGGDPASGGSRP